MRAVEKEMQSNVCVCWHCCGLMKCQDETVSTMVCITQLHKLTHIQNDMRPKVIQLCRVVVCVFFTKKQNVNKQNDQKMSLSQQPLKKHNENLVFFSENNQRVPPITGLSPGTPSLQIFRRFWPLSRLQPSCAPKSAEKLHTAR